MTSYTFSSKEELLEQAKKDDACSPGLEWAEKQKSLERIISNIPFNFRFWCLTKGYIQFEKNCPWKKFSGYDWTVLLSKQPQFSKHCDWNKLTEFEWEYFLFEQPQFKSFKPNPEKAVKFSFFNLFKF